MKDKNLKIEFNERAIFNMMHSVRIAIDKPVIQFHYQIEDIEIHHIRREFNSRADQLANEALDEI